MKDTIVTTQEFIRLLNGFEQELRKEGKDQATYIEPNKDRLMEFFCYLEANGINAIADITQSVINDYMHYMRLVRVNKNHGGTLEEGTVEKHINAIHKLWKYMDIEGIEANDVWIKRKKKTKQQEITPMSHAEIRQLYAVCTDTGEGYRDRGLLAIYYGCGLRRSEGARLLLSDIDFNKGWIHIRKTKNQRERYVIMSPKVQLYIEDYVYHYRDLHLEKFSNPDALFARVDGRPLGERTLSGRLQRLWIRVKKIYGTNKSISLHDLRHALGTHLYMAKMDIEMIALMLGHIRINTTQIYIHLTNVLRNEQI